jgi:hypothetical protein
MATASANEVAELLGDRADDAIVERILGFGASIDEVAEAIRDVEFQREYGEEREPSSEKVDELRVMLEEVFDADDGGGFVPDALVPGVDEEDDDEGLTIVGPEELGREPP